MKETILIRHAETYHNINQTEDLDSELTEKGLRQAKGLSDYLKQSGDAAGFSGFVSPFKRTLDTALEIAKSNDVRFRVFPLIGEYGATWNRYLYYVFVPERRRDYPMFDWSLYEQGRLFRAETFNQFLDRLRGALNEDLPEKTLFVSHGAVVYTLTDLLTGGGIIEEGYGQVSNACITKLVGKEPMYIFKQDWKGD